MTFDARDFNGLGIPHPSRRVGIYRLTLHYLRRAEVLTLRDLQRDSILFQSRMGLCASPTGLS